MKSLFLALFALVAMFIRPLRRPFLRTANAESTAGRHEHGILTKLSQVQHPSRHLFVMIGEDDDHATLCDGAHPALGLTDDQPWEADHPFNVRIPGATKGTDVVVATGALNDQTDIFLAANGQVQALPAAPGTYYRIGRTMGATQENYEGQFFVEAALRTPQKVVVLAAFGSSTTAAAVDLPTSEALANALKTDLNNLAAALATPAEVMVL